MIRHIVIFRFKGTPDERIELAKKFREALVVLPGKISCLRSIEVGLNVNPSENSDLVLTAVADSLADVAEYSAHPDHQAAVDIVRGRIESRSCADMEF